MLEQRGSNLLETLLAIGLVAAMTPFVYNRVAETTREIADVATAKQIVAWREPMTAYVRKNQIDWPPDAEVELSEEGVHGLITEQNTLAQRYLPVVAFLDKYQHLGGTNIDSYIIFPARFDGLRMRRIAKRLGIDAAIVDDEGMAYSASGGWSVESPLFQENDLIFRVTMTLARDDSWMYLHRMRSDDEMLNTMDRDLLMSRQNLSDADRILAGTLDSKMISSWFATADLFTTDDAVFPDGASLDGTNTSFSSVRVTGDIIGFRNIATARMEGPRAALNWAAQGNLVTDRANVLYSVNVGRTLNIKSSHSATVSGFSAVSAHSLAVPFLSTDEIHFGEGFGLSISNELSATFGSGPLRLGSGTRGWSFPSTSSPRFSDLILHRSPANLAAATPKGFDKILGKGWKSLREQE